MVSLDTIRNHWGMFVDSLQGLGSTGHLDAFLRSACEPEALDKGVLVLRFAHEFHRSKVEDRKYRCIVEGQLESFFGEPLRIECLLSSVRGPAKEQRGLRVLVNRTDNKEPSMYECDCGVLLSESPGGKWELRNLGATPKQMATMIQALALKLAEGHK